MKNRFLLFLILPLCVIVNLLPAQDNNTLDSLKQALRKAKEDTTRCVILNAMIEAEGDDHIWPKYNEQLRKLCEHNLKAYTSGPLYRFYLSQLAATFNNEGFLSNNQGNIPKALANYEKGLTMDQKAGNKKGTATSLNNIGSLYQYQGDIQKALEYYFKSLKINEEIKDVTGTAESLNNIGLIYNEKGDISQALEYYHKSLMLHESINYKIGMATALNNIGAIYQHQGDLQRALTYYNKSLKLEEETNNLSVMAGLLHNIGAIHKLLGDSAKALIFLNKSLKIAEETENLPGMAHCLNSIGSLYQVLGQKSLALEYWQRSLKIWEKINDKQGMALVSNHIAIALFDLGETAEALKYAEHSLKLAKELDFPENIKDATGTLSKIYSKTGKWKEAYELQVLYKQMSDTINSIEGRKAFLLKSFQYEYEKKAIADSIKSVEEHKVFDAQLKQQKIQKTALYCGIGLVTLFALFMYNRFRVTQKQKEIIEVKEKETQQQKQIIEEKHKEISDSINYAERIQRSFLATKELLDKNLKEYFVLFQPKDIVSGDFYWAAELLNGHFVLAVADSTGHGVPGAIMSLLNITSLEKAIERHSYPSEILNHTRKTIIDRLKKDGSAEGGKDGMDCSLMSVDFTNSQMTIAAAQNPVWIVRNVSSSDPDNHRDENAKEFIEIAYDKMPVGKHDNDHVSFKQQTVTLKKGDMIYAVTDGFADQFGGAKGKKFMQKRLKELLISVSDQKPYRQKEILSETLKKWAGGLEQVDDITLVGVRIS